MTKIPESQDLGDKVRNNLIDSIIKTLKNKDVEINLETDIMIYTSHSQSKLSYHIIINNFCHANNVEARAFYENVMDHVEPDFAKYIDKAIYSPTQQFRIVGSQKIDTTRIKTFQKTWEYHNTTVNYKYPETPDSPEHEFVMQLEASIIGYVGNCKFLPPFEPRVESMKNYEKCDDDVTKEDAKEAINLIAIAGKIKVTDSNFPYKFLGISGPIVMLKRIRASNCKLCNRVHENENPYLIVIGNEKSVFFHCRRAPDNKKLFLGKLNPDPEATEGTDQIKADMTKEVEVLNEIKTVWSKSVIEKLHLLARSGNPNEKRHAPVTDVKEEHKKQIVDMYINS